MDIIYEDELKDTLLTKEFHTKMTEYLLNFYIQFIKAHMPNLEHVLEKIHNRSVDVLKVGLW